MFSNCSIDVKIVIALLCTVPIFGRNTRKRLLVKFEYHSTTYTDVYLVSQIEAMQVKCTQIIIYVIARQFSEFFFVIQYND